MANLVSTEILEHIDVLKINGMPPIKGIPKLTHRLLPCFNEEEKSGCQESTFFSNLRFSMKISIAWFLHLHILT